MRKNTKWLAAVLLVCLLFNAAGTLAAGKDAPLDLTIQQVSRKVAIYSEPSKKSATYGYIVRNMPVLTVDMKNGFSEVQIGPIKGFVETKYLVTPNESVTVTGIASIKADTQLVGLPVRYIAQLSKGQTVYTLTSLGQFMFIKADGLIGFVKRESLVPYDEKSPVIEWVEMLKRTDIKESEGKTAARLARANKGNWVAVLQKLEDEKAVVRHGEIIGVMSLKDTKLVPPASSTPTLPIKGTPAPAPTASPDLAPEVQIGEYDQMAIELIDLMNGHRKKADKAELKVDTALMQAAQVRAEELTRRFSHTRPKGGLFTTVHKSIKAENIALGKYALYTAKEAVKGFLSSPEHKAIAMSADYTKTGAAWVLVDKQIYWVQLFG